MADLLLPSGLPDLSDRQEVDLWLLEREALLSDLIAEQLTRVVRETYEEFLETLPPDDTLTAAGDVAGLDKIIPRWEIVMRDVVEPFIDETYQIGGISAYTVANGKRMIPLKRAQGWTEVVNTQAVEYAITARNRLVGVGDTLWNMMTSKTSKAIERGASTEELKAELETLGRFSEFRADVIARTEVQAAYSNGTRDGLSALGEYGPVEKEWLSAVDARTRASHLEANGQIVPFDQVFSVGGVTMVGPHDLSAPAAETIQCRCTTLYYYEGDTRPDGTTVSRAIAPAATPVEIPPPAASEPVLTPEFRPGNWTTVTDDNLDAVVDQWTGLSPENSALSRQAAGDVLRRVLGQSQRAVLNGDVLVVDPVGVGDEAFDVLRDQVDAVRAYMKQAGQSIMVHPHRMKSGYLGDCTMVRHELARQTIRVDVNNLESAKMLATDGWKQASVPIEQRRWTIVHEWGHAVDRAYFDGAPRNMIFGKWKNKADEIGEGLSRYGKTDKYEGFAESFADWFTSGGKSTNPATQAYAKYYGWETP